MVDWNADLYRQFEQERTRPARDLLDRVLIDSPDRVIDLGCGPGNSTELLATRFPQAQIVGLDTSEDMLASASARLPACRFLKADIATWNPDLPVDVLYANASLQWVPDHQTLFPRLISALAPDGVLAVQMPDNFDEPSHRLMRQVAVEGPWAPIIGTAAERRVKRLPLPDYYDLLAPLSDDVEIWRTTYHHPMPSAETIVDWVRATGLRPFIDPLPEAQQAAFLAEYTRKVDAAYRPHADGRRLLAFPRMFIVARRKSR
jgi:trans-aconitate 2-methyltransferase